MRGLHGRVGLAFRFLREPLSGSGHESVNENGRGRGCDRHDRALTFIREAIHEKP